MTTFWTMAQLDDRFDSAVRAETPDDLGRSSNNVFESMRM